MKKNKFTAIVLSLFLFFAFFPCAFVPANADYAPIKISDSLDWNLNESTGVLTISGIGAMGNLRGNLPDVEKKIISVEIKNGITSIGEEAFYGCTGLTSITIPDSVTSIGAYAFFDTVYYNDASNWESGLLYIGNHLIKVKSDISGVVNIKSDTKTIADGAFYWCEGLTSITIPNSVTSIGDSAFYRCEGLTSITIPNSVTSIGEGVFSYCTGLNEIKVSEDNTVYHSAGNCLIETASKTLIQGCKTSVIPTDGSVTSIGDHAFYSCRGLTNITIPDSVTSIGDSAFYGCDGLTSNTIPDSVTSIGSYAFYRCEGLTSITIPNSVTSIGDWAFGDCSGLTTITIPDSVTSIGYMAFFYCTGLNEIKVSEDNTVYHSAGNCLIETASKTLILGCMSSAIPTDGSVTSIGDSAFYWCEGLTSITIPDSVTSIGDYAFFYCKGLTSITIGNGVTSIEEFAFDGCSGLESITILNQNCTIYNSSYTIDSGAVIYGHKNSTAETYAKNYSRTFVEIMCTEAEYIEPKDATCTESGSIGYYRCKDCGAIYLDEKLTQPISMVDALVDALGHNYSKEWTVDKEATTTQTGEKSYHCTRCNSRTDITVIAKLEMQEIKIAGNSNVSTVAELITATGGKTQILSADGKAVASNTALSSGMKIILKDTNGKTVDEKTVVVPGDVDGKDGISAADARMALRASVGLEKLNSWATNAANIDKNRAIEASDARMILRISVSLEKKLSTYLVK